MALILALCVYPAAAATLFWDGSGSSWSAVGSWSTSFTATTPDPVAVPGFADTALFNIGTVNSAQTIYLGGNQAASSLIFSNTSPTTFLGGSAGSPAANTLTLGTNGGALTIASVTAAAGNVTIGDTTGGGANVTPTLAGATNNIITVAAGRILNFANGLNFNTGKIQNNGAGTLVLNAAGSGAGLLSTVGATNYNIIARLDSGTVTLGSPTAFGTGVIDTRNETLQANTDLSGANKILNTFVLATGITTLGGSTNLELGGQFNVSSGATGPGILINNTAATTLSGNLYLSDLATTGKTLQITNLATAGPVTVSGLIANYTSGPGTAGGLSKTGSGTLIISGANNTYSGGTTIGAGGFAAVLRAAATQALGTGTITFDNTGNASTARLELTNGISLNNNLTLFARANNTAGIESLGGNNTLAGTITISIGGSFYIIQSDAGLLTLGTAGATAYTSSAAGYRTNTLQGAGNGIVVGNIINGLATNNVFKAGAGTWTLAGSNSYSGVTVLTAGTLVMASTNGLSTNGVTIAGTGNATLDFATDGADYTNVINAASGTIFTIASDVKTGSAGINHTLGLFSIGSGATPLQLNITSGPNVTSGNPQITAPLLLSGGSGGTTIVNPTTAKISFSSVTASATSKTLQLDGTNTGNTVTGSIADGGANVITLLKTNTSTWTLGGVNTYSGPTTIAQGTLALGSSGAINGSPTITLAAGATLDVSASSYSLGATQTLTGNGTVAGNFSDNPGSQIIPGGASAVGALNFTGNLTLAAGDTVKFDFASSTNDILNVNGNFANNAGSIINLASLPAGGLANGTYTLLNVSGTLGGSAGNFVITGKPSPSRQSFAIVYDTASSPKRVLLQVTGASAALVWLGSSAPWDILTSQNWTNPGTASADYYFDGDNVSFTDLGSAVSPVLNTSVQPGSVTFNSANAYTLSGTGAINGSASLTKAGSGTVTIQTTNNYTGVTALNGGVVSIATVTNGGFASPLGAAPSAAANLTFNGGKLQYTGATASTDRGATLNAGGGAVEVTSAATTLLFSGALVGSSGGSLTKSGNGTLVLSGANAFDGSTAINGGILQVGNGGATGKLGGGTITDNSALVVLRTGSLALTNNIGGTGNLTNNGTGTLTLSGVNTFTGGLTVNTGIVQVASAQGLGGTPAAFNPAQISVGVGELEASTSINLADTNSGVTVNAGTIAVDAGMTLLISNPVVVATSLTKALPGTLILSGSNNLSGILNVDTSSTTASDGALRLASPNALGGAQTIQVRANQGPGSSTLQLDGTAGSINVNPATFNWSGRNNLIPAVENIAGDNIWNPATVTLATGGAYYMFQCDAGSLTLPGTFPTTAPIAGRFFSFAGPGYFSLTGSFQSGGSTNIGLYVTNNATLTLWSGNSYTGVTSLQGGTLNAADGSSFGTVAGNIEIAPFTGETATLNISNATVTAQRVIVAGVTANTGTPGTGIVNQVNGTVNAAQWVTVGSGGAAGGTGTYNLSGTGTLNVQNTAGGTQLEVANFAGSSGTLNLSGASILNIENNAYLSLGANAGAGNGTVNQTGGTVTFYSDAGGTVGGNGILYLGKAAGLTSNYIYNLAGGTLVVPTITSASGNAQFYFNGGTLKAAKTNTAFLSGLTAANVSTGGAIIDDGGFPVTIAQALVHDPALGGADGGLTKQNTGTLILSGNNNYSGPTTISAGTLLINGANGTGLTTVDGGILGGTGTLAGAVDVQAGGTLAPGVGIGSLTINNNLALENGSTAQFNFGTGTNSEVLVGGAVNINGATAVSINYLSAVVAVGTYPLVQYGTLSGFGNLTVPTSPNPRFTFSLTNNTATKVIALVVRGNPASLTWHGDGSGNYWDNAGSYQNWLSGSSADYFYDGDAVLFSNSGSTTPAINLTATVSPSSITVNSANNYDFAGSGLIAGPGSLTVSGSGTLTLENNNAYTGPTIINNGTVQVGNGGTTGTLGSGNVTNNASLVLNRSDAVVLPTPIYGSGSLTLAGSGSVTATSSNYYTGPTHINSGIAYLANPAGLGATNGSITVASGAQLYISANVDVGANPLALLGSGDGNGALRKGGAGASTYNGAVTFNGNTTLSVDGGATLNFASPSPLDGAAANASLTLTGSGAGNFSGPLALGSGGLTVAAGTWTLAPGNNFTGLTALNAGTTRISDASLGNPATFTANQITLAGGTLEAVTNASFIDGKAGFTLLANATLAVDAGATLTISNNISGANNLTKSLPGTLVLKGYNAFTGTLYVDTASTTTSDGITVIASPAALANIPATAGTPTIYQRNNNGGSSTLQLDGTAGSLDIPQEFQISCRNNTVVNVENLAGNNTFSGNLDIQSGGGAIYFQSDAGTLNIAGNLQYVGTLTGGRTYNFGGAGNFVVNGSITSGVNAAAPISVAMNGTGTLTLANANTYPSSTTVSNGLLLLTGSITSTGGVLVGGGTLGGTGVINDAVSVVAGGTLAPGANGIGTLTINSNLTLAGVTSIKVNKTAGTSDQVAGVTALTYGGTLFATNLSGTLTVGDAFTVFNPLTHAGNFSAIAGSPGAGLAWSFNTNSGVLSVVSAAVPLTGLKFTASPVIAGTSLTFAATNTGAGTVYLLTSTNVAAALNSWKPIWTNVLAGSGSFTTNLVNAVNPAQGAHFFILSNTHN